MRHVFRVNDGDYTWDYSSESAAQALIEHIQMNYVGPDEVPPARLDCLSWTQVPDEVPLRIGDAGPDGETIERTCAEWAATEEGLIGTTCI